jgi:hypothetical protein
MPEISRFYGIVITLNFNDHVPPHFHAWYGDRRAIVEIASGAVMRGELPDSAARMVREWATIHRAELAEAWEQTRRGKAPFSIEPLE